MRYKYFLFFLLLICSSCSSHLNLDSPSFVKKIRKATYKKDYQHIKQLSEAPQVIDNKNPKLWLLFKMVKLSECLDTMIIPPIETDWIPIRYLEADAFEIISKEDGTIEKKLIKKGRLTKWYNQTHIMQGYRFLTTDQIRIIQKDLKKKKWFGGRIDGKWSNELLLTLRFYQITFLEESFHENLFSITNPPHRLDLNTLNHFGLIDIKKTWEYRSSHIIQDVQLALKSKGYFEGEANNVFDEVSKKALKQFQKDNGLPIGQLDFETLKALNIDY